MEGLVKPKLVVDLVNHGLVWIGSGQQFTGAARREIHDRKNDQRYAENDGEHEQYAFRYIFPHDRSITLSLTEWLVTRKSGKLLCRSSNSAAFSRLMGALHP